LNIIHTADPCIPLLLFTLDSIEGRMEEQARKAGFRGALAKGEGIFALSQAIEELLQGKTFFLNASANDARQSNVVSEGGTDLKIQSARE
jgi:DNA-binding NarL/FixJ family response regulator